MNKLEQKVRSNKAAKQKKKPKSYKHSQTTQEDRVAT